MTLEGEGHFSLYNNNECFFLYTLLGIIIVGLFTTGKIFDREKYGGILQNPPHYPGRLFTSDQPFNFKIQKITKI